MTSDAKIGLILGLAFIVLIAFLLTGLPTFLGKDANGGIQTTLPSAGVTVFLDEQAENAMQAIADMGIHEDVEERRINIGEDTAGDDRFSSGSNDTSVATGGNERINRPIPKKPRRYTVQSGDNLAKIAKKAYGPEEGNRFVNIEKIYKANTNVMKSIDDVKAGVKLIIPSLVVDTTPQTVEQAVEAGVLTRFRNAIGIGSTNSSEVVPEKFYLVKEGDTLWDIASIHLGDGNRYKEIEKLNTGTVGNADIVTAGIKLRLPVN